MAVIWELDFYSRPILDEQNKKVWEVLVCESPLSLDRQPDQLFQYQQFCPSTQVNSVWLKTALQEAIAQAAKPPSKIRFFRQAMNNMITKACDDLGIPAQLSRRTFALNQWLQQRFQAVYPTLPGYQASSNPSVSFATTPPQPLPDALMGQQWAFVTLEASAFADMHEWKIDFGESFPLSLTGVTPETPIPGLVIFSSRALPLAAWMSGLELSCLKFDSEPAPRLLLETGINDRWMLANLATSALQTEAKNFEATKQQAQNVHFLAIQANPDSEAFAGFWLLQEVNLA
ncbi:Tab2/Atab2 family RNA-binding protein [Pantanalinema rosaneae CENA516]|uniref:Tab2/Atab2 family RNA-binding protein n=1 Tax=Pantanalinema rosaneae TaxID=1620701 RepID=UPI003D6EB878